MSTLIGTTSDRPPTNNLLSSVPRLPASAESARARAFIHPLFLDIPHKVPLAQHDGYYA